jgi:Soluble lytic murein transglycosylase and related regulatory proteins (some contain LysM/invasin domains)
MKQVSFFGVLTFALLIGYIYYDQSKSYSTNQISNESGDPILTQESMPPFVAVSYDLPSKASFAGEEVPLSLPDVRERLDKELQINVYLQSSTLFLIKRAHRWLPKMQEILKANNIPDDFKYLPLIESALINARSGKDAVGYWQILESSGKELGLEITKEVDQRYDPIKATEAACKYLNKAYERFGSWSLVAASYNCGMSGLRRQIEDQKVNSYYDLHLNDETSRYVFRILAIKEIFENPTKYGFRLKDEHLYQPENHRLVEVTQSIPDLVTFAQAQGTNYKLLKRHNPWLRDNKLTVKKGKTYQIAIP